MARNGDNFGRARIPAGDPSPREQRTGKHLDAHELDAPRAEADDSDIAECVRFIESVKRESPDCLAGLIPTPDGEGNRKATEFLWSDREGFWLSPDSDSPAKIGRFQLVEKLGEGGFGIVFLALDPQLDRQVALKVPRIETLVTKETRLRFLREGKAAARLDHRNIATVYEAGQVGPLCYIVSAYCADGSLSDLLKSVAHGPEQLRGAAAEREALRPSPRAAASLIRELACGIQHAHERGILHRDLKPGNILFDFQRDQASQGLPGSDRWAYRLADEAQLACAARIVDFGLAKSVDDDSERTGTGTALGTPSYMSPEQARGDQRGIGPATDIYSLGAIFYELLTGKPPLRKESHVETIIAVKNEDPVAPRRIRAECPRDLEAICLKCLEKEPARRYASATLLSDDLDRYLQGKAVHARTPSFTSKMWRWCKRYPLAAMLTLVMAVLAIVGPLTAINQRRLYREASTARDDARRALYTSDMNLAMRDWHDANIKRCGDLLKRHLPHPGMRDYRGFEWFYLWRLWQASDRTPIVLHDGALQSIALSPDETLLAVGLDNGDLFLWDLIEQRKLRQWQAHPYRTFSIRFSADGRTLATANVDTEVKLWDVATFREIAGFSGSRSVAFSKADGALAFRAEGQIGILDAGAVEPRMILDAHGSRGGCVVFSPDGKYLASGGWNGRICIWDIAAGNCKLEMAGHGSAIWTIDWSADGRYVATADVVGTIKLWVAATGAEHGLLRGHTATINSVAFSPDSSTLASAAVDNTVKMWEVSSGSLLKDLRGHSGEVTSVAFAEHGRRLLTASGDGDVRSWDVAGKDAKARDVLQHPGAATSAAFSPNGQRIATGCGDGQIRIWAAASGELQSVFQAHAGNCWRVRFIRLGDRVGLVSAGQDGAVRIWENGGQQVWRELACVPDSSVPVPVAVTQDGSRLAFPDTDLTVQVWDLAEDRVVHSVTTGTPSGIEFTADGQYMAVAAGKSVSLWSLASGSQVYKGSTESRDLTSLSMSRDMKTLAVGSLDRTVKLWRLDLAAEGGGSAVQDAVFNGSAGAVWAAQFSPDSEMLVSTGNDQMVRLWNAQTGDQRSALRGHTASVSDIAIAPDGAMIATASDDRTVRLWRAPKD